MPTFSDRPQFKTATDNAEAQSSSRSASPERLQSYRHRAMMFSPAYAEKYQGALMRSEQQQERVSTIEHDSRGKEPARERVHPHTSSRLVETIVAENGLPRAKDLELNKDNERLVGGMWNAINKYTEKKAEQYWERQTKKWQFQHCDCLGHIKLRQDYKKFKNRKQEQTSNQQEETSSQTSNQQEETSSQTSD